jgi:hypothetical protein
MNEIMDAYSTQIGKGMPFFLLFDDEARRLPFLRLYAQDTNQQKLSFESGVNCFRFSRKFVFEECF